jgi:hypothetical protein
MAQTARQHPGCHLARSARPRPDRHAHLFPGVSDEIFRRVMSWNWRCSASFAILVHCRRSTARTSVLNWTPTLDDVQVAQRLRARAGVTVLVGHMGAGRRSAAPTDFGLRGGFPACPKRTDPRLANDTGGIAGPAHDDISDYRVSILHPHSYYCPKQLQFLFSPQKQIIPRPSSRRHTLLRLLGSAQFTPVD